jgi:E3 ubiquitin-protein ligase RGLG
MGNCTSAPKETPHYGVYTTSTSENPHAPLTRSDTAYKHFKSLAQVKTALKSAGLEACQLVIGVDMTKSNTWTGTKTFGGRCLHEIGAKPNPYEQVISIIGRTLKDFDDDGQIPLYGFGDVTTSDHSVFSFKTDEGGAPVSCDGFDDALVTYRQKSLVTKLSGPTSFVPIINEAIRVAQSEGGYHVLIIIADGGIDDAELNTTEIVRASQYAISIIMVGVGDGPWDTMRKFDDEIPDRRFDNFKFVNFHEIVSDPLVENVEAAFAMNALQEIPTQYQYIKQNRLIRSGQAEGAPPGGTF